MYSIKFIFDKACAYIKNWRKAFFVPIYYGFHVWRRVLYGEWATHFHIVISAYHSPPLTHITTHTLVHFRRKHVEICIFGFELVVVHPFYEQHFVLHRNFRTTTIPLIAEIFRTGTVIGQHANRLACLCTKTYDVVFLWIWLSTGWSPKHNLHANVWGPMHRACLGRSTTAVRYHHRPATATETIERTWFGEFNWFQILNDFRPNGDRSGKTV